MRDYVFVCYAREDETFVLTLAANLKDRGLDVWLDQWNIPAGTDWDMAIDDALYDCTTFLIVLSPAAVRSREVRGELRTALDENKTIIPVLYKQCRIPRQLRLMQYVDFRTRGADNQAALTQIVQAAPTAGDGAADTPAPSAPIDTSQLWRQRTDWESQLGDAFGVEDDQPVETVEEWPEFYEQKEWWLALVLLPLLGIGGAYLAHLLLRIGFGWIGVELIPLGDAWLPLGLTGLVWGIIYLLAATLEGDVGIELFFPVLGPYGDIFDFYELGDVLRGVLSALPINLLISWGGAHLLAFALAYFIDVSTGTTFIYIVFAVLTLDGMRRYIGWYVFL